MFCILKIKTESYLLSKTNKAPFIIHTDVEFLAEKIDGCKNNPKNWSKIKVGEHIPSGFSISTISPFKSMKKKHNVYRGKDCIK